MLTTILSISGDEQFSIQFLKLFLEKMPNLPLRTAFLIVATTCFYGLETRLSFAAGDHPDFPSAE